MNEETPGRGAADLLAQDGGITASRLQESRNNLMNSLDAVEIRARKVFLAFLVGLATVIAGLLARLPLEMLFHQTPIIETLRTIWFAFCVAASLCTAILLTLYNEKYKPAISRTQDRILAANLADLQRQVSLLAERVNKRPD
ncbi:hypothetical protein EP7_002644 [Isosphaeraceae bacterium EP7]